MLTGQMWSDPIQLAVDVDEDTSRSTAVLIIATQNSIGLSREDQTIIAEACGAVSPVTSYVVAGSRARPPQRAEEHGVEGGVCGCDARGDISGVVGLPPPPPVRPDLAEMIDARTCHATRDVELAIDTTSDEIVDVTIRGPIDPVSTCVAEAAWRVRLDNRFDAASDHFTAVVRPR